MIEAQPTTTVFSHGDPVRGVSVIVPLFNYGRLLPETLDSVAAQTHPDVALIVVDDASEDDSCAVAEGWMRDHADSGQSLLLLRHENNARLARTRNTGIAHARSPLCFFLDADNLLFPRCLEVHAAALDATPDAAGAQSLIEEFGSDSTIKGSNVFSRDRLKLGNYIDAMAMVRRHALIELNGVRHIDHGWEDYDLWLRLCETRQRLVHIPQILSRYRHHNTSMLRLQTNVDANILELWRNMQALHPWLDLKKPEPWVKPSNLSNEQLRELMLRRHASKLKAPILKESSPSATADSIYADRLLSKIADGGKPRLIPATLKVEVDYTGPITGTAFDAFESDDQRDRTRAQVERMLRLGISWINPAPGVHSSRDETGELLRYRSLASDNAPIQSLPNRFLLHVHAFYPDIVGEMLERLTGSARSARLILTVTTEKNYVAVSKIVEAEGFANALVLQIENRGRDIGPFIDIVLGHAGSDDILGHVHTKKSPDLTESHGIRWRAAMYGSLLSQGAIDAFTDDRLGLLFPDSSRSVGWGRNRDLCQDIAERLDTTLPAHPGPLPVGNMFFVRAPVAAAMRAATQGTVWPREPVPYDGTPLHAIERMWPAACQASGYDWAAIYPTLD